MMNQPDPQQPNPDPTGGQNQTWPSPGQPAYPPQPGPPPASYPQQPSYPQQYPTPPGTYPPPSPDNAPPGYAPPQPGYPPSQGYPPQQPGYPPPAPAARLPTAAGIPAPTAIWLWCAAAGLHAVTAVWCAPNGAAIKGAEPLGTVDWSASRAAAHRGGDVRGAGADASRYLYCQHPRWIDDHGEYSRVIHRCRAGANVRQGLRQMGRRRDPGDLPGFSPANR
jgi:hypothetical protein